MEDSRHLSSTRATIDPDGDLVLEVQGRELLVSRKVLCLSSSVFRAMLRNGSAFIESTGPVISDDGLQHIRLQEDDYEAMRIMTNVIHLQHDWVPTKISFEFLDALAILCDKYDLRKCLGLWPQKWSKPWNEFVSEPGYERWLFIALVFRNKASFTQISKHLMLAKTLDDPLFSRSSRTIEGVPTGILGNCNRFLPQN